MAKLAYACLNKCFVLYCAPVGPLAQLVEQRTFNPLVSRSSRERPTKLAMDI